MLVLRHFRRSYVKANKVKVQGRLNMRIIFESVLMLFTQNYHNQSMLDETIACQSRLVFLRHSVYTVTCSRPPGAIETSS